MNLCVYKKDVTWRQIAFSLNSCASVLSKRRIILFCKVLRTVLVYTVMVLEVLAD